MTLEGRRALVTGAAQGIGAAIATRLAADGAEVIVADIDLEAAQRHAAAVGAGARAVHVDVADPASARAAVAESGPVDILVNNAAIDNPGVFFTDITPERWRRILAVNLEGVFACTQAVLPGMQAARSGRIVNIASEAARIGAKANSVYAASKGALLAFTMSLARENARYAVTVNAVCPGPIDTPMLRSMDPRAVEVITAMTQLKRLGTPEEVAATVAFLCSGPAAYITGEVIGVSGGMHLGG